MGTRESLQQPCVCDLRDACCSDDRCAQVVAEIAGAVKADIDHDRIRERLQVLEGWKLDADGAELVLVHEHETYLKSLLDGDVASGCRACRGTRFKTCRACGEPANSFHDHRDGASRPQLYPTKQDWRALKTARGRD